MRILQSAVNIFYISAIYFVLAFLFSLLINKTFLKLSKEKNSSKSKRRLITEIFIHVMLLCFVVFFVREIVLSLPLGDDIHAKEWSMAPVFIFTFFFFQFHLKDKMEHLYNKLE